MLTKQDLEQIGEVIDERIPSIVDKQIKKHLKPVNIKINRIQKDISLLIKTYDSHVVGLRTRVEKLEEHTGIHKN